MKRLFGLVVLAVFMLYPQLSFGADAIEGLCTAVTELYSNATVTDTEVITPVVDLWSPGYNIEADFSIIYSATDTNDKLSVVVYSSLTSDQAGSYIAEAPRDYDNDGTETETPIIRVGPQSGFGHGFYWLGVRSAGADDFNISVLWTQCRYNIP